MVNKDTSDRENKILDIEGDVNKEFNQKQNELNANMENIKERIESNLSVKVDVDIIIDSTERHFVEMDVLQFVRKLNVKNEH